MKAKEFLNWVLDNQISLDYAQMIEISEGDQFESQEDFIELMFGVVPTKNIPSGDYVYIYISDDETDFDAILKIKDKAEMILKLPDSPNVEREDFVFLFRMED